jgi:UDP-N-acetylglucosamine/UDP-N-acetylgalactosamine diphosphorylase
VPVDNPLAFPFDPQLIGFHAKQKNDITIQAVQRSDPLEQAGVLALVNEKPTVAEYSELADAEKEARDFQGNLKFGLTNIGLYCFSLSFLNQACAQQLPFHLAKKAVKRLDENAVVTFPDMPNAIKFEEFIFDAFPSAEQVQALVYPRQWCFAPLKNLKGGDSPETVRQALLTWDRTIFAKITGNEPPSTIVFELAPQFYYPTEELLQRWKGKPFPNQDYIYE